MVYTNTSYKWLLLKLGKIEGLSGASRDFVGGAFITMRSMSTFHCACADLPAPGGPTCFIMSFAQCLLMTVRGQMYFWYKPSASTCFHLVPPVLQLGRMAHWTCDVHNPSQVYLLLVIVCCEVCSKDGVSSQIHLHPTGL